MRTCEKDTASEHTKTRSSSDNAKIVFSPCMPWLNVFGFSAGTLSTQCSPPWASATSRLKIRRNVYFPCLPCTWERLSSALCCPRSKMPCLSSGGSCHFVAPPPLHFEVSTDHAHAPLFLPCALSGFILALCTCVSAFKHPTFGVQYALMHTPPPCTVHAHIMEHEFARLGKVHALVTLTRTTTA